MSAEQGGLLQLWPVAGLPEIGPGADLPGLILEREPALADGDVVVISHKVVSKMEGRVVPLAAVTPSPRARDLAASLGKDPRLVEVILQESAAVLRASRGVLICRTHHGFVCANAGVDSSNAPGPEQVVLLPRDPDASARRLRAGFAAKGGVKVGVVITDSFGRPWRNGQQEVAIGVAGIAPLHDLRGQRDRRGALLQATWIAVADQLAAAADLVREKRSGQPVVIARGGRIGVLAGDGPGAAALLRDPSDDLFS